MKKQDKKLKKVFEYKQPAWQKAARLRIKNKVWLGYSSQIARRILSALDDVGITQKQLAEKTGVTPQRISKILKGQENLTLENIAKLSTALKTDLITFPHYKEMLKPSDIKTRFIQAEQNLISSGKKASQERLKN